ncbi:pentapeptide repeat-containing protein [Falsiroseomonas oryzae]|uniref:pentapeptide repeat-containing protein n=1 Tax=Falsiroseomonas oryzae TaxID=2766473 RepID=UPI0022EB4E19|nr:pentapeptide repeat-containing protein [Roseomonas sp. MO-31]
METFGLCSISPLVFPRHLPALVLLTILVAQPALAACTDPPAPEVVWRRCLLDGRDLSGADLSRAHLRDASFQRGRLGGTRLVGADATDARFVSADLTGADMTEATLREADFTRATLRGAKLMRTDMRRARLFRADLTGADLTGAELGGADLSGATLDGARWTDGQRVCAVGSVGTCQ